MAKKRKTKPEPSIDDLVRIAQEVGMADNALNGDVRDECDFEADMMFEQLESEPLRDRLEFLRQHGYELSRLEELIRQAAATK